MLPHPHPIMPQHHHHNMPPHPYPSMPPQPIFCPCCASAHIYAPYEVQHYPCIPPLSYLHRPTSKIPSSVLPNLFPPESRHCSSKSMNEDSSNSSNGQSNEQKRISRYARTIM